MSQQAAENEMGMNPRASTRPPDKPGLAETENTHSHLQYLLCGSVDIPPISSMHTQKRPPHPHHVILPLPTLAHPRTPDFHSHTPVILSNT